MTDRWYPHHDKAQELEEIYRKNFCDDCGKRLGTGHHLGCKFRRNNEI